MNLQPVMAQLHEPENDINNPQSPVTVDGLSMTRADNLKEVATPRCT